MYNDLLTPDLLTTFTGLVVATSIIVQFTKPIVKRQLGDGFVRFYTFFIALILTFIFARTNDGIRGIILNVINSILITMAAMGGYEIVSDPRAEKMRFRKK